MPLLFDKTMTGLPFRLGFKIRSHETKKELQSTMAKMGMANKDPFLEETPEQRARNMEMCQWVKRISNWFWLMLALWFITSRPISALWLWLHYMGRIK